MRENRNIKMGVIKKGPIHIPVTTIMDTIVNVPLHPKSNTPIFKKMEIEEVRKLSKGWHMRWNVILMRRRGGRREELYIRTVIA